MLINLRNALMSGKRLPYDAEVEYLESTGTQWIDTGVVHDGVSRWELNAAFLDTGSSSIQTGQTSLDGDYAPRFAVGTISNNSRFYCGIGNVNYTAQKVADHDIHLFVADALNSLFSIDSTNYTIAWSTFLLPPSQVGGLALFGRKIIDTGAISPYAKMRIYSSKHYRNGVLVRDFVPVRKGTVGYLYDRVSGKLFGNAGTGAFVLGPDKN